MRVLGIAGSLRRDSHNRQLLRAAAKLLAPEVELVEFEGLKRVPPFDEDDERDPALAVHALRDAIADADAVLFATPEYNGSVSGVLKNAVDWASRPLASAALRNKPVAVIGASTGLFGAVWAQADLRKALGLAGARVIDRQLPVAEAGEAFAPDATLRNAELELELAGILLELVEQTRERAAA